MKQKNKKERSSDKRRKLKVPERPQIKGFAGAKEIKARKPSYQRIPLKKIRLRHDQTAEEDAVVSAIAESYKSEKQINALIVRLIKVRSGGKKKIRYELITGVHRYEALKYQVLKRWTAK